AVGGPAAAGGADPADPRGLGRGQHVAAGAAGACGGRRRAARGDGVADASDAVAGDAGGADGGGAGVCERAGAVPVDERRQDRQRRVPHAGRRRGVPPGGAHRSGGARAQRRAQRARPAGQRPAAVRAGHEHAAGAVLVGHGRERRLPRVQAVPAQRVPAVRAPVAARRARVRAAGRRVPGRGRPAAVLAPEAPRRRRQNLRVPRGHDPERQRRAAAPGRAPVGLSARLWRPHERRLHCRTARRHARAASDHPVAHGPPARLAAAARRRRHPPHPRDLRRSARAPAPLHQAPRPRPPPGRAPGLGPAGRRPAVRARRLHPAVQPAQPVQPVQPAQPCSRRPAAAPAAALPEARPAAQPRRRRRC
ncbi:hypothetical protein IWQ57_006634, partial [Coemansia nantahalensis]